MFEVFSLSLSLWDCYNGGEIELGPKVVFTTTKSKQAEPELSDVSDSLSVCLSALLQCRG